MGEQTQSTKCQNINRHTGLWSVCRSSDLKVEPSWLRMYYIYLKTLFNSKMIIIALCAARMMVNAVVWQIDGVRKLNLAITSAMWCLSPSLVVSTDLAKGLQFSSKFFVHNIHRIITKPTWPWERSLTFIFGPCCVTRAPLLYFIRSWVALSFKVVSESVSQASVTPAQISTSCNI